MMNTLNMYRTRLVSCFVVSFLVILRLDAQEVYSFTSDSDLSNTCINSITEDSRKNVWICTRNGLNRFDGAKMNVYHSQSDKDGSLKNDVVMCVLDVGREGLLVGLDVGVQLYSYYKDDFKDIPLLGVNGDTVRAHVVSMARTHDDEVYVCTAGYGLYKLQRDTHGCAHFNEISHSYKAHPIRMMEDSRKNLWVIDVEGNIYRKTDGHISMMGNVPEAGEFCESSSGQVYLSTTHRGLYRYAEKEGRFVYTGVGGNYIISSIRPGAEGEVMVATDGGGLNIYDELTGHLTKSNISTYEYNLTSSNVKAAMIDSNGNLWVGVYWKGVLVLPTIRSGFNYIGRRSVLKNTIGTNCVTAMAEDGTGNLWVATDHCGIYHLTHDGMSSVHFKPGEAEGMPSTVMAIHEDSEGTLWLGTSYSGVMRMDKKTGRCTPFSSIVKGGSEIHNCYDMVEDGYGRLWFATMGKGVFCYNLKTHVLNHYKGLKNNAISYPYEIVSNIYVNKLFIHDDKLYLGTYDGLEKFDLNGGKMMKAVGRYCAGYVIKDIGVDAKGILWLGSGNGLMRFNSQTGEKKIYNSSDGLSDNTVKSLEICPEGKIWMGTDNGISCFNLSTGTFENYYAMDGLQGNEFSANASLLMNGNLYFGGINGLVYFRSSEVGKNTLGQVDLRVVDFYVNGKAVHQGDYSGSYLIMNGWTPEVKNFNLAHFDNTFSVELVVMNAIHPRVTYSYCLNNGDWKTLENGQNRITFTGMDPGTYRLRIKAEAYGSVSDVKEICVVIHPEWYFSTLAKFIYFLLFLFLCYIAIRQFREHYRAKRILEEHRHVEELNDARIQFFMNISHEIRTPMSLILSPLMKLMKNDKDEERQRSYSLIYQNAQRILRLINQLMDARKIEKGQFSLKYNKVELVGFINNLYELFEGTAHARNIDFTFVHAMERMEVCIDPQNFDKVIMNLLSNAFKFTPDGGRVTIELKDTDGAHHVMQDFVLSVTDTGVGVPDKDKSRIFRRFYSGNYGSDYVGTGIGLNLTKLLVELHEGSIEAKDNPAGKGTSFIVRMPKRQDDLKDMEIEEFIAKQTPEETIEKERTWGTEADVQNGKRSDKHYNVLIVEDDVPIRRYLHGEFASHYYVDECANGQEAWDYIIKNAGKVDLVVSDVMMPLMDGTELCRKIKESYNTNHIPVILLTAMSDDAARLKGLEIGADAYISKPFNMEILFQTAENLLVSRRMLQGKYSLAARSEEKIDNVKLQSADEQLMERIMKVMNDNLANSELSVEDIADKICLSRVHFHRKLKELTGMTPRDFLKNIRLTQAAKLLSEKHLDITDVSIATGFKSVSTFSTCFKAAYGMPPTEYMKLHSVSSAGNAAKEGERSDS